MSLNDEVHSVIDSISLKDLRGMKIHPLEPTNGSPQGNENTFNRRPLPVRSPMNPYPRQGNHVPVSNEAMLKFNSQQRQLMNLNKKLEKGKISEKNYLHQAKSIMS